MAAPKLDAEIKRKIVGAIQTGMRRGAAAKACGLHPSTVSKWLQKGESEGCDDVYSEFRKAVLIAEASHEQMLVNAMTDALVDPFGKTDGNVAMAMLKTRHGWTYGSDKFIDYLVHKLHEGHPELLTEILEDIKNGALD
jgi:transposase